MIFMTESISRKELCGYLSLLRRQLAGQSLFPAPNVIFLNSRAIYHHLAMQTCGGITVGEILQKIETCIPLADNGGKLFASSLRLQGAKGRAHAQLSGKQ